MCYLILLYVKTLKKRLFSSKNTGLHSDALSIFIYIHVYIYINIYIYTYIYIYMRCGSPKKRSLWDLGLDGN